MSDEKNDKAPDVTSGPVGIPMGEFKVGVVVPLVEKSGADTPSDEKLGDALAGLKDVRLTVSAPSARVEERLVLEKKLAAAEACLTDIRKALRDDGETPDDELALLAAITTSGFVGMSNRLETSTEMVKLLSGRVEEHEKVICALLVDNEALQRCADLLHEWLETEMYPQRPASQHERVRGFLSRADAALARLDEARKKVAP
jgi:hypothetical protein